MSHLRILLQAQRFKFDFVHNKFHDISSHRPINIPVQESPDMKFVFEVPDKFLKTGQVHSLLMSTGSIFGGFVPIVLYQK